MAVKNLYQQYVLNTYTRVGPIFVRGKGDFLWDKRSVKYLDLFPGWGVNILGHAHPKIARVIADQAKTLMHIPNNLYHPHQAMLAKEIIKNSFKGKVFFANSGAEAIEGAIKLAKAYGKTHKKSQIVCMQDSFHGRTLGALSCTIQKKYQAPFTPLLSGVKVARFGDFADMRRKVNKKTAAVLLEPIQGEAGVNLALGGYFHKLRKLCTKYNILLVFDEVQTGMGRTGKMFCFQHYGIIPDVVTLSKGLGAGFPVSAFVVRQKYARILKPGMHASTFGGNPMAARVALEVFGILKREKILANVKKQEKILKQTLFEFKHKFGIIKEVRGMGLMWAIELDIDSSFVFREALRQKLIINSTQKRVLRIMPALNIDTKTLHKGLSILEKVLKKFN